MTDIDDLLIERHPVELLSISDLRRYPTPEWLITDHIHKGDVAVLYGLPGSGKSFLAIDWALSVATGLPWLGFTVAQAPVLYMAGEGAPSMYKRVRAWMKAHRVQDVPGAYFNLHPLPLREFEVIQEIQETLQAYQGSHMGVEPGLYPGLIIVDTLSQFFGGGDEVSPDMTQFVHNMRYLAQKQNVAVLIIHHTNVTGMRERGHSSLRGNVEVMFRVAAIEAKNQIIGIALENDKQKDDPQTKPMQLSLTCITDSLTISLGNSHLFQNDQIELTDKSLMILLTTIGTLESEKTESSTHADVIHALKMGRPTFHRRLDKLKKLKLVTGAGRGKSALTLKGRNTLSHFECST